MMLFVLTYVYFSIPLEEVLISVTKFFHAITKFTRLQNSQTTSFISHRRNIVSRIIKCFLNMTKPYFCESL